MWRRGRCLVYVGVAPDDAVLVAAAAAHVEAGVALFAGGDSGGGGVQRGVVDVRSGADGEYVLLMSFLVFVYMMKHCACVAAAGEKSRCGCALQCSMMYRV